MTSPRWSPINSISRSRAWWTVIILVTLPLAMGHHNHASNEAGATPPLEVSTDDLNVGEIWAADQVGHRITIRNTSSHPLTIARFRTSCPCISVDPGSLALDPHAAATVSVRLDMARLATSAVNNSQLLLRASIHPVLSQDRALEYRAPCIWNFTGVIRPILDVDTRSICLDDLDVEGPRTVTKIRLRSFAKLRSLHAIGDREFAEYEVVDLGDCSYSLELTPHHSLHPGPFRFHITLIPEFLSGERASLNLLTVSGVVHSSVELSPPSIHHGIVSVDTTRDFSIGLRSRGGQPVDLRAIEADDGIKVLGRESIDGLTKFSFRHTISKVGDHRAHVAFEVVTQGGNVTTLDAPVAYHGFKPD